ncbi:MAG TPA: HNH endonuclease [Bacillota bacterium]
MSTWIFQGRPDIFMIDTYLRDRRNIWWRATQPRCRKEIRPDDQIFIWRSDGKKRSSGGIVARARVMGPPELVADDAPELRIGGEWKEVDYRVPLEVTEVRPDTSMIKRIFLLQHPILKTLRIHRMRTETNYLVSPEHASALERLWMEAVDGCDLDDERFPEGKESFRAHRIVERNPRLAQAAKEQGIDPYGNLRCQVCGFSFRDRYGPVGDGFIEAHHTLPVSEVPGPHEVSINDIALVCSNCHRMLHLRRPWLTMVQLRSLLRPD